MKYSLIVLVIMAYSTIASSAEISVVVHPSNDAEISIDDVSHLFLGKTRNFPNGTSAVPINQSLNSQITVNFYERVMNRTPKQLKAYWSKQVFSGVGSPPKEVSTDEEVLKLISKNPNLIGYIDSSKVTDEVKVVLTK